MDINLLSKMIKELILEKDRVVLPGLGSFVAEVVPSTFSDKGFTINPPYRKISFRSKPDKGEDLVEFYARLNGVDVPMAGRIIEDFIRELRTNLYTKKVVVFPELGRLRATKENNVFFIPDEDLEIYPAGLGLEPISLKTHKETQEELSEAVFGLKSIIDQPVPQAQEEKAEVLEDLKPVEVPVEVAVEETVVDKPLKKSGGRKWWLLVAAAVILLVAYVAVARMVPGIFDTILYTPEELEILNYKI